MEQPRIVEVAVPLPVDETFDYALRSPEEVQPGTRVLIPYGKRRLVGTAVSVRPGPGPGNLREIARVIDAEPPLPRSLLDVVLGAAREALCPPGLALAAALPPGTAPRPSTHVELLRGGRRALERGEVRGSAAACLRALERGPLERGTLRVRFPQVSDGLEGLERLGWVRRVAGTAAPRTSVKTERVYRLAEGLDLDAALGEHARAPRRREILERLRDGPARLPSMPPLRALVEAGSVRWTDEPVSRIATPAPLSSEAEVPRLTGHQSDAVDELAGAIRERRGQPYLLYGVTGSGKTEVYLRAAQIALEQGRGAIVLVPEISLTHQVVDRFRSRFGDRVAVLHSGLSAGERFDHWRRIRAGEVPIAIGARSAVFAPFEDLGLVVIDEEHDPAYKSGDAFRYHARDIALHRARASGCPLVLGSATPDVGTAHRTAHGEIQRLSLPERIARRPLPSVEIVDMQQERPTRGRPAMLSAALRHALNETLQAGQQSILFLNRRGFATLVYCFSCGHALHCRHCDIALVYHATGGARRRDDPAEGELRCHYCGYLEPPRLTCAGCGSTEGGLLGFGTERLAEEIAGMFPHARVARLDRDTSSRKGAQRAILGAFHRGDVDVLVGTQMIAKGHDVPGVTLVGVIAADLGLHFPDFRAGERTFQLLTQVAGRAGRGEQPGRVIIQTFLPDHYAIALARTHDFPRFYAEELARRQPHGYPPFRSMVQIQLSARAEQRVRDAASELAGRAKDVEPGLDGIELLGPAPAPLPRIRDRFRWQLLLLGEPGRVRDVARELAKLARGSVFSGVRVRLDANPLQML